MILIDNRNYLRLQDRSLLQALSKHDEKTENVSVEPSKKGLPTLKLTVGGYTQYIHSKYDPEKESERLQQQRDIPENVRHVLFFGAGLGYHIKALLKQYPDMKYSIYEPNLEVLNQFLSHQSLQELSVHRLQKIFTSSKEEDIQSVMRKLYQWAGKDIYIYTLPVYEKLYAKEYTAVMKTLKELLKDKRSNLAVGLSFQKRWTINSIKNFPKVLQTPNILHDVDKSAFEGKPAIIVAAGPSLSEEFENLKHIKENGLAYIFSVGSAINALIEHGIYPDAACTYDPKEANQIAFQRLKADNINQIPLVFGSSVGFETLEKYPGPMLHMITSQDTVAPHLLDISQNIDIVLDAPSIAVVTFQLLKLLGCRSIILAGQNLAYQNNRRYSDGIQYEHIANELTQEEKEKSICVKDVYGNDVQTNDGFNRMRKQLEWYISQSPEIEVINTTKGGAHIAGTSFLSLAQVMENHLTEKGIVSNNWHSVNNQYNKDYIKKKLRKMNLNYEKCQQLIGSTTQELKKIESMVVQHQANRLEYEFAKFDKEFAKLKANPYYQAFIEPMMQVQNEQLSEESQLLRYEKNAIRKGNLVIKLFSRFLKDIQAHFVFVKDYFTELREELENHFKGNQ